MQASRQRSDRFALRAGPGAALLALVTLFALTASSVAQPAAEGPPPATQDEMRRRLRALVEGRADDAGDPSQLFTVALDDPDAVGKRVDALQNEVRQARTTVDTIQARLADLDHDYPPPARPAELDAPLDEPVAPTPPGPAPTAPERPAALDVPLPPEPPEPPAPAMPRPVAEAPPAPPAAPRPATDTVAPPPADAVAQPPSDVAPVPPPPPDGTAAPSTPPDTVASSPAGPPDATGPQREDAVEDATATVDTAVAVDASAAAAAATAAAAEERAAALREWAEWDAAHAAWEAVHGDWEQARAARDATVREFAAAEVRHAEALAAHAAAVTTYEADLAAYESAVAARIAEAERRAAVETQWKAALVEHAAAQAERRTALEAEADSARARLDTASARLDFLRDVKAMLDSMPGPAIGTLARLRAPRVALRRYADVVSEVTRSLDALARRVNVLADRTAVGGVLGFRVEREELEQQLRGTGEAIASRAEECRKLADDVRATATRFEEDGRGLYRRLFATLRAPQRGAVVDGLFGERLDRLRRQRRARPETAADEMTDGEVRVLLGALNGLLPQPDSIGTTGDGETEAGSILAQLAEVDGFITALRHSMDRWDLLVARETVSVLESLASDEARSRAYSLSEELLEDLQAEAVALWERLRVWGGDWLDRVGALPDTLSTGAGRWGLLRLLGAIALGLLLIPVARRVPRGVSWFVRRLARRHFARGRVGAIVRTAGLVQTILPTLVAAGGAYGIFALLGFENVEVAFTEVVVRWWLVFRLGRKALEGLTQRVTPGRPALVALAPATATLLSLTYARGGLVLAAAAVVSELSRRFLGLGVLHTLLVTLFWLWLAAVWGVWATLAWRTTLAAAWQGIAEEGGREARVARFMTEHRLGAIFAPFALLRIVVHGAVGFVRRLTLEHGLSAYLRARTLKRMSRRTVDEGDGALPERYTREFPLYPILGEEEALLLPRDVHVAGILEQFTAWRKTRSDGSLALIGEKGVGKTTLLGMLERRLGETGGPDLRIDTHMIVQKVVTPEALARELSVALLGEETEDPDVLVKALLGGPERVVLLDEVHNIFLRVVDGFRAINALGRLMNATAPRVFWVSAFNGFAWSFIAESRRQARAFRRRVQAPPWSVGELRELVASRNQRSGFAVEFDEALLDTPTAGGSGFALLEGADGYFRLLWEASGGNPRVATWLWLRSLRVIAPERLRVGVFRTSKDEALRTLDPELVFALAAFCQHENLTVEELARVLNVAPDFAEFSVRFLMEAGYVEPKMYDAARFTLAPAFYPQVIAALQLRNLLYVTR